MAGFWERVYNWLTGRKELFETHTPDAYSEGDVIVRDGEEYRISAVHRAGNTSLREDGIRPCFKIYGHKE